MDTLAAPQQSRVVPDISAGLHTGLVERLAVMKTEYTDVFRQYAVAQQVGINYEHATGFMDRVYRLWESAREFAAIPDREARRIVTNIRYGTELIIGRAVPNMFP